jgi:hypothetical protein
MRLDVIPGGPMAAFTTSIGRFFFADGDAFEMRVPVELKPNVSVTGFAGITTHIGIFRRFCFQRFRFRWLGLRRIRAVRRYRKKKEKC